MKDVNFLTDFINSYSPSGFENDAQQKWCDYIAPYVSKLDIDKYCNAVGSIEELIKDKFQEEVPCLFNVVFSAHVDEVSFRISHIGETGLINVIKNGNSDHLLAPGSRAIIHTEKGIVDGIFGWPSINTRTVSEDKESKPTIDTIFIDCGLSKKELIKLGVEVGCTVTYPGNFKQVGKFYTGKGFDNKIGGYILSQVIKNVSENKIPHDSNLSFVNAVQEEVGLRGSQIFCNYDNPVDVAITIDVTHDTGILSRKKYGDIFCGGGPVITVSPTTQQKLVKFIRETAEKNGIPYQLKTLAKTNTDTESYMVKGIVSALVSIPIKYMHSQVEMVHIKDVANTIFLLTKLAETLNSKIDFSILKNNKK